MQCPLEELHDEDPQQEAMESVNKIARLITECMAKFEYHPFAYGTHKDAPLSYIHRIQPFLDYTTEMLRRIKVDGYRRRLSLERQDKDAEKETAEVNALVETMRDELEKEIQSLKAALSQKDILLESQKSYRERAQATMKHLEQELDQKAECEDEALGILRAKLTETARQLEDEKKAVKFAQDRFKVLKVEHVALKASEEKVSQVLKATKDEKHAAESKNAKLSIQIKQFEEETSDVKGFHNKLLERIKSLEREKRQLEEELSSVKSAKDGLSLKVDRLDKDKMQYEELVQKYQVNADQDVHDRHMFLDTIESVEDEKDQAEIMCEDLKSQLNAINAQNTVLVDHVRHLETKVVRHRDIEADLRAKRDKSKKETAALQDKVALLNQKVEKLLEAHEEQVDQYIAFSEAMKEMATENNDLISEKETMALKIEDLNEVVAIRYSEKEDALQKVEALGKDVKTLNEVVALRYAEKEDAIASAKALGKELKTLKEEMAALEEKSSTLKDENDMLKHDWVQVE